MARKSPESSLASQFLRKDTEIVVRPQAKEVNQPLCERVMSGEEPLVFLHTNEASPRITRHLQVICQDLIPQRKLFVAGPHLGIYEVTPEGKTGEIIVKSQEAKMETVLNKIVELSAPGTEQPAVFFMPNPGHTYFMENTRGALPTTAALFSVMETLKHKGNTLVMAAPIATTLPPEYHSTVRPMNFPPPDEMERRAIIHTKLESVRRQIENDKRKGLDPEELYVEAGIIPRLVDALTGLTEGQINAILSRTIGWYSQISTVEEANIFERIDEFRRETAEGSGFLKVINTERSHEVAGCDGFFAWLEKRRGAFRAGHPLFPNVIGFTGMSGTGKTLLAERIGKETQLTTYGVVKRGLAGEGIVGSKTRAMAAVLAEAEAAAGNKGCVVVFDEAEKYFAGQHSSAFTEGGATEEAVGIYTTVMQEWANNHTPVCLVMTINRIGLMEPEQIRAGGRGNTVAMFNPPTKETRQQAAGILLNYWQREYQRSGLRLEIDEGVTPQFIAEVTDFENAKELGIPPRVFTGADIRGALENAIIPHQGKEVITEDSFIEAVRGSTSAVGLFPEEALKMMTQSLQVPDVTTGRPLTSQEAQERYRPLIEAARIASTELGHFIKTDQPLVEEETHPLQETPPLSYIRRR